MTSSTATCPCYSSQTAFAASHRDVIPPPIPPHRDGSIYLATQPDDRSGATHARQMFRDRRTGGLRVPRIHPSGSSRGRGDHLMTTARKRPVDSTRLGCTATTRNPRRDRRQRWRCLPNERGGDLADDAVESALAAGERRFSIVGARSVRRDLQNIRANRYVWWVRGHLVLAGGSRTSRRSEWTIDRQFLP